MERPAMELPHALKDSGPEWLDVQPLLSRASNDLQVLQYRCFSTEASLYCSCSAIRSIVYGGHCSATLCAGLAVLVQAYSV